MRTVWKYHLPIQDEPTDLTIPKGAEVLFVDDQGLGSVVSLWMLVDPERGVVPRRFTVRCTGQPIHDDSEQYVGSCLMYGGSLVWHVFETPPS
jgi:hypothetical protein